MTEFCMLCDSINEEEFNSMDLNDFYGNNKEDGERIIAIKKGDRVELWNRRNVEKGFVYEEIINSLKKLDFDFVIDGEVTTHDGIFNSLQRRAGVRNPIEIKRRMVEIPVKYMIFDIIRLEDKDLTKLPLSDRIKFLDKFKGIENVEILPYLEGEDIRKLWDLVKTQDKEGIILKAKNSVYEFRRAKTWIKLKNFKEIEIEFGEYEVNNAGVKLSTGFYEVQVQDDSSDRVEKIKKKIDKGEKVKVVIQYLERTKDNKLRFPSCKEVIG